ncbi:Ig-like domain repeat protein [Kitasatospora cathayae]|uniref:Ig-like domain repeat protein n=1 Tax=Kitasatospora cathayae TaxID=3004092 RepID=A0ABY7PXV2_9ACTN|nr:Ig-like domain repeat protein [Kitasatospora sp. HUAS 3-15]WBP85190.1 Ig-like domain repeat protein [Kitasatospora sp. HUAS 3-15]
MAKSFQSTWRQLLGLGRLKQSAAVVTPPDPTVAVGSFPTGVAITPDGLHAYVTNEGDNTVSVIATATNTVTATIPVGSGPFDVAITPDGLHAYVTNEGGNSVSVIATATNTTVATIPVGSGPFGVAVAPGGLHAYVTNSGDNTVSVIATVTNTVTATVAVGTVPFGVAITPDGLHAYVTNEGGNSVSVIDTATNTVTATVAVGAAPTGVAVSPDGLHAYVTNNGDNTVSVIATATNTVTATITVGAAPTGVAVSPDGLHAYVTNNGDNTVSVIATATNTTVATIPVGTGPFDVAITPDGLHEYVTNNSANTVSVTDTVPFTTATALASAPDPSVFGQAKVLTATVTSVDGIPTGTVSFFDGVTLLGTATLVAGVATFTTSTLSVGSHALTAVYGGDTAFSGSTSPVDTQTVNAADTTTVLISAPDPSVFGEPKVLTATVTSVAGVPTGTVSFFDGVTLLGTATLVAGVATFTASALGVGSHALTAVYGGDTSFSGSTSPVDTQTVNAADTTTVLISVPDPSVFGEPKVLTATVTSVAGVPTGTVSFFDGVTLLGTGTLVAGVATFTTSALGVGSHALTAVYGGDTSFSGSTSPVDTQTVNAADTTTVLTSVPDPSVFGEPKVLTATVTSVAGVPTGTVSFFDGVTLLGTATLVAGVATFTASALGVGSHALTAVYGGDTSFSGSTSPVDTQTVNAADTTTVLISVPDPSVFGEPKVLTATVTSVAGVPTGTVSFFDGVTLLGTGTLVAGVATFTTSALGVGSHALTAVYGGDTSFSGSTSPVDTQTVNAADTTTVLTSVPDPSVFGEPKVLTATVTSVAGVPTGTVSFFDGATLLGTGTLVAGVATFTTSALGVGSHALTAVYSGDTAFSGSTSPVDTQTVNAADTTTVLISAPDPSVFGEPKVLTATVTSVAGVPTGTVSFFDGATLLGTGTLVAGVATFTTSALGVGSHALTAVYGGDTSFSGSTSPVDAQTVNAADTSTVLTSVPDPSVFGEPKVLTATVTSVAGVPTGTVSFFDGVTLLGTGTLVAGVATFTTSALGVGSHALTAVYGGDTSFSGSTSPVDTQTVNAADTTTALTSAPDPSVFGQAKVLTATVTVVAPGVGVPTGTVSFFDGATLLGTGTLDPSGVATFTTSGLSVGSHALTAVYGGDTDFNGSTSPVDTQTVNAADTTTALTSAPDPSVFGEPKVLTATVTSGAGIPTGTVSFFDGATLLGTATLVAGVATFTTSALSVGSHALTAVYGGDTSFNGSTSPVDTQTVNAADTTTVLTSAPDPSVFGQAKVLTAAVTVVAPGVGVPTGTVSFFDGVTLLGTGTLVAGVATFTTSALSVGSHALTAVYGGDTSFNGSTSPVDAQTVNAADITTVLTSVPDPSVFGEAKVLTATVTVVAPGVGVPTGTVSFFDGATLLGTGTLVAGVATFTASTLSVGSHALTAVYSGDTAFSGSTSPVDTQTVNAADTTTVLTSAPDPSVFGQAKVLTATVTAVAPGVGTPTGTVSFFDGVTLLGTGTLVAGVATFTASTLSVGSHALTAVYSGDTAFSGSTSPVDAQTVNAADTTTVLTSVPDPSVFGEAKVLTATVTVVAPGVGVPTGTVSFFDGVTLLGTGTLVAGVATFTASTLSVGSHALTAVYSGDTAFSGSTSPVDTQTVNAADTTTVLTSAPDPSVFGQAKVLTATVTAVAPGVGTPTGTVSFFDGVTLLGTGTLVAGVATFTASTLSVGSHALTAVYGGDTAFSGSTSPVDTQTVNAADTTTVLISVPDPSVFGEPKVLTATVTSVAGVPTGTVSFFDGVTLLGTGTLVAGVATFTASTLSVGSHALTAVYGGDTAFSGSTSPVDAQTVNAADTTTVLTSVPDPSVFGEPKVLTATVTSGAGIPTGTVSFFDGATLLGTGTLVAGVATFTTSALGVGSHALTAVYSGDTSFNGSTSPVDTQTVNTANTTTALTSAPDPSVFGEPKVLTATVTAVAPGVGVPTGTVSFFDGATLLGTATLVAGVATFTTSALGVGSHALTAVYGGDTAFSGSTSPVDAQTVNAADTTTVLTSVPDPSVFGEAKVLTATVTSGAGIPTGTVSFFDGATLLGTATLVAGVATFTTSALGVGSHALTAVYSGDTSFNGSTSPVDTQTVNAADTTTALTSAPDPSVLGEPKVLTATVTAVAPGVGIPTGTVSFFDGATLLGTATLVAGVATFTTSALSVGSHALTAVYGGDTDFSGSTSPVDAQTVTPAGTVTVLTSVPDPSVFGEPKVLTATVTAVAPGVGVPTGTVSFFDGATLLGTATLVAGVATFTTSALSVGSHALTAVYGGDTDFSGSTSPVDAQTVTPAGTVTVLTSVPDPSVFGEPKVLTATVTAVAPGVGVPTGTVSFFDGATLLGTATLAGGVATFTTSGLGVGSHALTAVYGGDTDFSGSTSPVDTQTVTPAGTVTVLTSVPDPSVFGEPKVLTATVTAVAPGVGVPTGTVSFFDGATLLGTATLAGGVATFTTSGLGVGSHALTAVYGGDTDFSGSTSPVDAQTVNAADTTTVLTSAPDPSVFGQAKVLTATVTAVAPGAGTPTGTVSFFDGATLLGTATLVAGVATFTTSTLGVGSHALTAVYGGDTDFSGSTSPVDTQTVTPAGTVTVLTSVPDPSVFGQAKVLTATVTAVAPGVGVPTGTVSFFDGATLLGTATLAGGVATFTTSALGVGSHALTAVYGGDTDFNGSTSPVDIQTVTPAGTVTVLTSAPDPSVFGQPKVLTATVTVVAPGVGVPTGTVSFFDGATLLGTGTLVAGVATFTTSGLSVGSHALTAVYSGSVGFNGSTSPVDTQTVAKANTTTALTSVPDPSVFGQAKVLTATVTAVAPGVGVPTGTVSFFDGATLLGTATLAAGVATFTTSALGVGSHALTAVYSGSVGFNGSTSPVDTQTVAKANTTTALTSAPDPSVFGQAKVLTATVTAVAPGAGTPTGTVSFFDGATLLGTATLVAGVATFTTSALGVGSHALTAVYSGSARFNGSTSPVDTQTVAKANTTTALTSVPDPSVFGQPKVLTATITAVAPGAGTPTGTVSFFDGATLLGTATLVAGVATFTTSGLGVGSHALTAVYSGSARFNGSTSPVDTQTVAKANTTTALTSAPDPSVFGQPKVLTATITAVAPGAGTPTGTVSFFDGATLLGTATLVAGVATFTTSGLGVGSHALTAVYSGSARFNGSTSPVDTQTVTSPALPILKLVVPPFGPAGGGNDVILIGSNLNGITGVTFGGVPAVIVWQYSGAIVAVVAPPHAPGTVPVVVHTSSGPSNPMSYTYF